MPRADCSPQRLGQLGRPQHSEPRLPRQAFRCCSVMLEEITAPLTDPVNSTLQVNVAARKVGQSKKKSKKQTKKQTLFYHACHIASLLEIVILET